ncbi:hypothetical protein ACWEFD_17890 [Streptomyces ardesiacus]
MAQSTDRPLGRARDVTGEHASKAALVLALVAKVLREGAADETVEPTKFAVAVGVQAYDQAGRSCHGGGQNVSRMALRAVGDVAEGTMRGELAERVAEAAAALGYDWSDEDNAPAIPKLPVPGPRESDESGRVPLPRRARKAVGR